jgi:hypothetical protein
MVAARGDLVLAAAQLRSALRARVQRDVLAQALTPEGVAAYAALHLTTDAGMPLIPAAHHKLWLQVLCDERIDKLLIIAPPESAKTSWTLSAFTGAYIGCFPERSVLIASSSGPIAEKRSISLRNAIATRAWRQTYPNLAPALGLPWKTNQWSIAPNGQPHSGRLHPTLSAYGTGGSVVGSRADLIVADDLLDSLNTSTAYQREGVKLWFHTTLYSRLKSRTGRIVVIGTAWHASDLYAELRRQGSWVVVHTRLLSEEGQPQIAYIQYPDGWNGTTVGKQANGPPAFLAGTTLGSVAKTEGA